MWSTSKTGCICHRRAEASRIQQTARFVFDLIIAAFNSKRHHPEFTPVDVFLYFIIQFEYKKGQVCRLKIDLFKIKNNL